MSLFRNYAKPARRHRFFDFGPPDPDFDPLWSNVAIVVFVVLASTLLGTGLWLVFAG